MHGYPGNLGVTIANSLMHTKSHDHTQKSDPLWTKLTQERVGENALGKLTGFGQSSTMQAAIMRSNTMRETACALMDQCYEHGPTQDLVAKAAYTLSDMYAFKKERKVAGSGIDHMSRLTPFNDVTRKALKSLIRDVVIDAAFEDPRTNTDSAAKKAFEAIKKGGRPLDALKPFLANSNIPKKKASEDVKEIAPETTTRKKAPSTPASHEPANPFDDYYEQKTP